jgi:hypothetical protein
MLGSNEEEYAAVAHYYRSRRQPLHRGRRDECAAEAASSGDRKHGSNLAWRCAMLARLNDKDECQSSEDEICASDYQCRGAQEPLPDEPPHALGNIRPISRARLAPLHRPSSHWGKKDERREVRDGIGDEWHRATDVEEEATDRRSRQRRGEVPRLSLRDRRTELSWRHDLCESSRCCGVECNREYALDESNKENQLKPSRSERKEERKSTDRSQTSPSQTTISLRLSMRSASAPAGRNSRMGTVLQNPTSPAFAGEPVRNKHKQRVCDLRHPRAECRNELADPEQDEIAIASQRNLRSGH